MLNKNKDVFGMFSQISVLIITLLSCFHVIFIYGAGTAALLIMMYMFVTFQLLRRNHKYQRSFTKLYLFIVMFVLYSLIQLLFIEHSQSTSNSTQTILIGFALITYLGLQINSKESLQDLLKIWGISIFCTIPVGWWEFVTGNHFPTSNANLHPDLPKATTVGFSNPNDYSFLLILSLPVILYFISLGKRYTIAGIFMLISSFTFIFNNGARFILLIFFGVVTLHLIGKLRRNKKLIFPFVLIIGIMGFYYNDIFVKSFEEIKTINSNDYSVGVRFSLSNATLDVFKGNLFGVGSGKIESYIGGNVHNFWLEILANYGLVVFTGFVLFFTLILFRLFSSRKIRELNNVMYPIFLATLIFIFACISSSSIFRFSFLWYFLGVLLCCLNIIKQYKLEEKHSQTDLEIGLDTIKVN